jgi:hypothetical protein
LPPPHADNSSKADKAAACCAIRIFDFLSDIWRSFMMGLINGGLVF